MKLRSKKTGLVHDESKAGWITMKKNGLSRNYTVLDDTDDTTEPIEVKVEPIPMEDIDDDMAEDNTEQLMKEFYQAELIQAGIEFHWNEGITKLKQKYEEI